MGAEQHRKDSPARVRVGLLTVSDTRTVDDDASGQAARSLLVEAGHAVTAYQIVRDEPALVAELVRGWCARGEVDVIVTSGGTGLSGRDRTFEAISALIERPIPGFGELFRALSFAEIGAAAMLSRATAGLCGGVAVFSCPGSEHAVRLALGRLILPELGHVVREARR